MHTGYALRVAAYEEEKPANSWQQNNNNERKNTVLPIERLHGASVRDSRVATNFSATAVSFACALVAIEAFMNVRGAMAEHCTANAKPTCCRCRHGFQT